MALFHRPNMPLAEEAPESITEPFAPRSAGDELRQRREAAGLDLGGVAAALRIKPAYLRALEFGRPEELPGAVYAIGYMRAYADHLGLDSGEMLRRFKQELTLLAAKPDLAFPILLREPSMRGGGMLLVALILAACAYGGWFYLSTGEGPRPERVAEVPLELLPYQEPYRAPPAVSAPAEAQAAPRSPTALSEGSGRSSLIEAASGSGGSPGGAGSSVAAVPPTNEPAPDPPGEVVIRATADSWISDPRRSPVSASDARSEGRRELPGAGSAGIVDAHRQCRGSGDHGERRSGAADRGKRYGPAQCRARWARLARRQRGSQLSRPFLRRRKRLYGVYARANHARIDP